MTVLNTLLEITIYSGVLFAAIMLFRTVLKKQLSPLLLYAVWIILIARLLVPFTPDLGFRFITLQPETAQQTVLTQEPAYNQSDTAPVLNQTMPPSMNTQVAMLPAATAPDAVPAVDESVPQNETVVTLTFSDILVLVWIAGAAVSIAWLLAASLRLNKRLKLLSYPPSPTLQKLAVQIQSELKIKQDIRIAVLQGISSPALSPGLRPFVLIPEKIVLQGGAPVTFALRHELMHLKRRDNLACLLLYYLRAVYWFNPVVWLAVRQIKADMETLCDSMVVGPMEPDEKKSYASTILNLFADREQKHFALGMALGSTKKLAERRIKGIYMRSRSGTRAKAVAVFLAAVLPVACFTTACQPIQSVSGDVQAPAGATQSQYKETKKLNDIVTVNYDASIVQPSAVPQATLQVRDFTEADMQKVIDYFLAGKQLYAPWTPTKTEVQNQINSIQQGDKDKQAKKDAFISQHAWAAELYQAYSRGGVKFEANDQTEQIKAKYKLTARDESAFLDACYDAGIDDILLKSDTLALVTAPDTVEKKPATVKFSTGYSFMSGPVQIGGKNIDYSGTGDGCTLWSENADGTVSDVDGLSQYKGKFGWIQYYRQYSPLPERKPLTIPKDQAQKLAEQAVASICPDLTLTDSSASTRSYVFNFTRKVAGMPISYDSHGDYEFAYQNGNDLKIIPYENIEVAVDDGGISRFEWQNPYSDVKITQIASQLKISMDEAKKKFETNILATLVNGKYADKNDAGKMDSIKLDISKIELGLTRIQDDAGNFSLVPTWDFYGKATAIKDGQEQIFNRFGQNDDNDSLGTINALDGTEINRAGLQEQW